jgi:hypothetical protein
MDVLSLVMENQCANAAMNGIVKKVIQLAHMKKKWHLCS